MKTMLVATALAAALAAPAFAGPRETAGTKDGVVVSHVITVSCWRGPWQEVIWDRPNPVFIDSLVAVGYDYPTALAIGTRICRNVATVGDPEQMKAEMREAYANAPAYR